MDTYDNLKLAVEAWALRTEVIDPDMFARFVRMSEDHLNANLRISDMAERKHSATTQGFSFYNFPTNSHGIRNIEIENNGRRYPLDYYTPQRMDEEFGSITRQGVPCAYSIHARKFELRPVPSGDFVLRITHYAQIPALTSTNQTTWLLTKYPTLYLYGILHFYYKHTRDENATKEWGDSFTALVKQITTIDAEDTWSGSTGMMRSG